MSESPTTQRKISLTASGDLGLSFTTEDPAAPGRRFALLIFCDDAAQHTLLDETGIVVGRERPSEVVVDDPSVSRQHARFTLQDGDVWVEDLQSRNGTFVGGEKIRKRRLVGGDEITIGTARVVVAATRQREEPTERVAPETDVIRNEKMRRIYADAGRAAQTNLTVLILGETGAGKERVATAIHRESPRRDKPLVVINCAAIPAGLLESTLFGHERGAFTGATQRVPGVFERADGGVLFLDEVGELSASAQAALLRVIETRRVCRIGGTSEVTVDTRLVAATHCDLETMVEDGSFRQDLYFRLSGIVLEVPPLRERRDEIEPLARHFLTNAREEWSAAATDIDPEALEVLKDYAWPGNIRQLRNAVERTALLRGSGSVRISDLPEYLFERNTESPQQILQDFGTGNLALKAYLLRCERALIEEALRRAGGNRQLAAKLLRISARTLFRRMRATGVAEEAGPDS